MLPHDSNTNHTSQIDKGSRCRFELKTVFDMEYIFQVETDSEKLSYESVLSFERNNPITPWDYSNFFNLLYLFILPLLK